MGWLSGYACELHPIDNATCVAAAAKGRSSSSALNGELLRIMAFIDQLDLPHIMAAEFACRELVKAELAVERCPKNPDWDGLGIITGARLTDTGAVNLREFNAWLSSAQKDRAFVMKQGRLVREEEALRNKDKKKEKAKAKAKAEAEET